MKVEELTDKAIDYMLPELKTLADENDRRLSDWEKTQFIPSVMDQWARVRKMSPKQREILGRIWDKT
jgi:hypothetical protein